MTGIEDKIAEAEELVSRFAPAVMNGAVPEREDFHKLCVTMVEVLRWIAAHDDGRMLSRKRIPEFRDSNSI